MADPITIQWGVLGTEIVKNIIVGGCASLITSMFFLKKIRSAEVKESAAPQPGRCSSHIYIEHNVVYIKNVLRWQAGLLYQICHALKIEVSPEPKEETVDTVKR